MVIMLMRNGIISGNIGTSGSGNINNGNYANEEWYY